MTLQSDVALPPYSFRSLSRCILEDLAPEFERAIFLAGAPVQQEAQIGKIISVATTASLEAKLQDAGIELAEGVGLVGGITGALVIECYHAGVPAAVLIVGAHPFIPDPGTARNVIEDALEPLVQFNIDTTELQEQSDEIRRGMQQIAAQYQQMTEEPEIEQSPQLASPSMYQ